jgi:hypothetical protein
MWMPTLCITSQLENQLQGFSILHLINKTPLDWYSEKQATIETATYGSEFMAAHVCIEQIIDLRSTLRYLWVPIREKNFMFGNNKSVIDSSMEVHAKLHKCHTMLSFHHVREAIVSGLVGFHFIPGEHNPADILSKHCTREFKISGIRGVTIFWSEYRWNIGKQFYLVYVKST